MKTLWRRNPLNRYQNLTASFRIKNTQKDPSGGFYVRFYLSENDIVSTYDRYLGSHWVSDVPGNGTTGYLSKQLTLPHKGDPFWSQGDGTYTVGMIVDANNQVKEVDEANNRNLGQWRDKDSLSVYNTQHRVTVTINRLKGKFDGPLRFLGKSDFYTKVSFDDKPYSTYNWLTSPTIRNDNDISPNWSFSKYVTDSTVPITIQAYDADGFLRGGDDPVDIDPGGGRDLNLTYNLNTGLITGDRTGFRGWPISAKDKGEIWFTVNHS